LFTITQPTRTKRKGNPMTQVLEDTTTTTRTRTAPERPPAAEDRRPSLALVAVAAAALIAVAVIVALVVSDDLSSPARPVVGQRAARLAAVSALAAEDGLTGLSPASLTPVATAPFGAVPSAVNQAGVAAVAGQQGLSGLSPASMAPIGAQANVGCSGLSPASASGCTAADPSFGG
jgi:hypothetical protein